MRKLCFAVVGLLWLIGSPSDSYAQFNRKSIKKNNHRIASYRGQKHGFGRQNIYSGIGVSLNALNYFGDLAPLPQRISTDISFTKPGFGISFFHRFGPRYTLQFQYMYGTLKGSDTESAKPSDLGNGYYRYQRNLSFRNRIHELSVVAYFDLFDNQATYISRVKWTPYVFLGAALFYHNPQAQAPAKDLKGNILPQAGQWVDLQPLGTEGQNATLQQSDVNFGIKPYSLLQFAIPFGIGARFRLNEVMDLWADLGFRYTFTDYLDDVSKNFVDLGVFKDPLAQAMSYRAGELNPPKVTSYLGRDGQTYNVIPGYGEEFRDNIRGNSGQKDIYMVTSIRLTYIMGATFHKAKFR
jgi:Domain of unknown function (DUF6089)